MSTLVNGEYNVFDYTSVVKENIYFTESRSLDHSTMFKNKV